MKKFEYTTILLDIEEKLELGNEGWEAYSVVAVGGGLYRYFLKREINK